MPHLQKIGGIAAFLNVVVAIATFAVAIFWIGVSALTDPNILIDMAINNPTPLLVQDGLKFVSAAISIVLILAIASYLRRNASGLLSIATVFGLLSVFCLVGNAVLSLYAIFQAAAHTPVILPGGQINTMIGILAMAAIGLDGVWFLLISWVALKGQQFPRSLCYLGFGLGILSLVPPLGIIVLLLGIVWSAWIGRVLLREEPVG